MVPLANLGIGEELGGKEEELGGRLGRDSRTWKLEPQARGGVTLEDSELESDLVYSGKCICNNV